MVVSDITARIARYLPKFVNPEAEVSSKIFATIAKELKKIYDEIEALKNDDQSGKGLLLAAKDRQIFYDTKEPFNDADILSLVNNSLGINGERATDSGILNDLNNLHREQYLEWQDLTPEGEDSFCPIMDVTFYPEEYYGIDMNKVIVIEEGDGVRPLNEVEKRIIEQKMVPTDATVIYI